MAARHCLLFAVVLMAGARLVPLADIRSPAGNQSVPFRFGELPIANGSLIHLARLHGDFPRHGLNYVGVQIPTGAEVVAALRSPEPSGVHACGIASTPVAGMIAAGDRPVILATTVMSDEGVQLLTFTDSGITRDPSSLRGKRIGVVRNTVGDVYLSRLMKKGGLAESDVAIRNAGAAELRDMLVDDALDAAVLWDPFPAQVMRNYRAGVTNGIKKDRGPARILVEPGLYRLTFNVVTTADQLSRRRDDLTCLLRALVVSGNRVAEDPRTAQAELEDLFGLEPGDLDHFMTTTSFRVHLDRQAMIACLAKELWWMKGRQSSLQVPADLSHYVDASLLAAVDPARVTP